MMRRICNADQAAFGLTLVELLVVIIVIAGLMALLFPMLARALGKAQLGSCMSNVRQIGMAVQMYAEDNNNLCPNASTAWSDLHIEPKLLICPGAVQLANGYGYNQAISGVSTLNSYMQTTHIVVVADCQANSPTPNLLDSAFSDVDYRHNGFAAFGYLDGQSCIACSAPKPETIRGQ